MVDIPTVSMPKNNAPSNLATLVTLYCVTKLFLEMPIFVTSPKHTCTINNCLISILSATPVRYMVYLGKGEVFATTDFRKFAKFVKKVLDPLLQLMKNESETTVFPLYLC